MTREQKLEEALRTLLDVFNWELYEAYREGVHDAHDILKAPRNETVMVLMRKRQARKAFTQTGAELRAAALLSPPPNAGPELITGHEYYGRGDGEYCWEHVSEFGNGDCGQPASRHGRKP